MVSDSLTDIAGLRVGHATLLGDGQLTGTTVVLAPEGGAVAAVDVRGGGPGTRETDALDPRNLVQRVEAVVLTGGSAYGLDAAAGVMAWLEEHGRGVRVGPGPRHVVPVVPAACVFDLGRGGDFGARPDAAAGRAAVEAAARTEPFTPVEQGNVGAGTGAVVGRVKGGVGSVSARLESGITVAALVVANAAGSGIDPATGALYGSYFEAAQDGQAGQERRAGRGWEGRGREGRGPLPAPEVHEAALRRLADIAAENGAQPLNTTLAVVATDAALTKAQAQKLAGTSHDGMARAVRPVHLLNDGDTVFALATGERPLADGSPLALNEILAASADLVTAAIVRAMLAAESVRTPGGTFPSYRELYAK
ncbi:P1 family peptidase [Streptomyces sp. A1499]|uniref:P1 family peptidase n=1 Tax=Streptomyces sp. A1499 TaxID=2563104 RepID=UPI00109E444E|nr:P1 family peptidase [Streptomyces sp. A1499]THC47856.1 peptidase S58 family protein [Streptomyces sp. A1499]